MGTEKGSYSTHDDPQHLLLSFPVVAQAVEKLHLQGHIDQNPRSLARTIWMNLQLESAFAREGSKDAPSPLIPAGALIPETLLVAENTPPLAWKQLKYSGETLKRLRICFLDEEHFEVFDSKKGFLGLGKLEESFHFSEGEFTLSANNSRTSSSFNLSFLPLKSVVQALQKKISVKKSKENPLLLNITYTFENRKKAAEILNAVMEAYQLFMQDLNQKKTEKQLFYLHQRKVATLQELEVQMKEHEKYLVQHIEAGGFLTLKEEAAFMMEKQARYIEKLSELALQMQKISESLSGEPPETRVNTNLERKEVEELLASYQKEYDKIEHQRRNYNQTLEQLADNPTEIASLTTTFEEPSLHSLFQQIQSLQSQKVDELNYTSKERSYFGEELKTKKKILENKLTHLLKSSEQRMQILTEKIQALKANYLLLLREEESKIALLLQKLQQAEATFPEKWFHEEKLHLNVDISRTLIEQISKGIEGRNMASHMESINSYPLEYAHPPLLPQPPYLCFFLLGGSLLSTTLFLFYLFWKGWRGGLSASLRNMQELGFQVIGEDQELCKEIFLHLNQNKAHLILMTGQLVNFYKEELFTLFPKSLHIDLTEAEGSGVADYLQSGDLPYTKRGDLTYLPLGEGSLFGVLQSEAFKELLAELKKSYSFIFIENRNSPQCVENRILYTLVDQVLYLVSEEKSKELADLPEKTLFLYPKRASKENSLREYWEGEKKLYLREIKPLLDKLERRWQRINR